VLRVLAGHVAGRSAAGDVVASNEGIPLALSNLPHSLSLRRLEEGGQRDDSTVRLQASGGFDCRRGENKRMWA
jgi:hypothetical protein